MTRAVLPGYAACMAFAQPEYLLEVLDCCAPAFRA
jgi:hypothetical protein